MSRAQIFSGGNGTCKSLTCEVWRHVSPTNDLGSSGIAGRPSLKVFRKRKRRQSLQSLLRIKIPKCWKYPSFSFLESKAKDNNWSASWCTLPIASCVWLSCSQRGAPVKMEKWPFGFHGWPQVMSTEKWIPHQKKRTYISCIQRHTICISHAGCERCFSPLGEVGNSSNSMLMKFKVFVPLKTAMCVFQQRNPSKYSGLLDAWGRIQNAETHSENHQGILFRFCLMDLNRRFA